VNEVIAGQIAALLNSQNGLPRAYDSTGVLRSGDDYLFELGETSQVAAAVEVRKVQWYQCEVRHLTVHPSARGRGFGKKLLSRAEDRAKDLGARVLQCTIRCGNRASESLFAGMGFVRGISFRNEKTGNRVVVWQKPLSCQG